MSDDYSTSELRARSGVGFHTLAPLAVLLVLVTAGWFIQSQFHIEGSEAANEQSADIQPGSDQIQWRASAIQSTPGATASDGERALLLTVDGEERLIHTTAATIAAVLNEQKIPLAWKDEIWLDGVRVDLQSDLPGSTERSGSNGMPISVPQPEQTAMLIQIKRAIPITIVDGAALPATTYSTADTVLEVLASEQIVLYPEDAVFPDVESQLSAGLQVVIKRSIPLQIRVDGQKLETRSTADTVAGALAEHGLILMGYDQVSPPLATMLETHLKIDITRIREEYSYEDEVIPFDTVWRSRKAIPIDQRRVETRGNAGTLRHRYRSRYENGEMVSTTQEDEWVHIEPETKVIAYGSGVEPKTLETVDGLITYWRKVRMYATSYSPKRSGTLKTAPWYGRTRLGMQLRKGIVAVDPSVINMRQKMYIPGYGQAVAGDTGGGVVGKHIDLGYSDDDYRSWHRWTDVYLLWPPPPEHSIRYVLPNWPTYPDRGR